MARLVLLGALLGALCATAVQGSLDGSQVEAGLGRQPKDKPHEYNYNRHGIDWRDEGLDNCAGSMQSPINIDMATLNRGEERSDVSGLYLNGLASPAYDVAADVTVNAEQDMKITFKDVAQNNMPAIKIDGSDMLFKPMQLHFHHFLSEHAINGAHYPLEAHLVMGDASGNTNQLAVLGIMYQYGEQPDDFVQRLQTKTIDEIATNGAGYGETVNVTDLSVNIMKDVLPPTHHNYVGYDGSLTTPPCDERVKWHVFTEPRTTTTGQLEKFLMIAKRGHTDAIVTNNRIVQPIGRPLYHYKPTPAAYNYARKGFDWEASNLMNCVGDRQSPINIPSPDTPSEFSNYNNGALQEIPPSNRISLNGLTSQSFTFTDAYVNLEQDMKISFTAPTNNLPTISINGNEESFRPIQLHFHHFSSEHTVGGMIYPLEAHLVMASQAENSNQLAVIAIFYEYGSEADDFLTRLHTEAISAQQGNANWGDNNVPINLPITFATDLMPSSQGYFAYDGSLTTPPCDQRVKWIVMKEARTTTAEQMETFKTATVNAHYAAEVVNNRVIQNKAGRPVYSSP
uniref:Carbonic anhydrase n=1 Tax=Dunaliella viridis TaxID=140095 RepID=I3WBF5_9CHLO|nr:duplicated carbonic anhydrase [Dunaliella viridis]